MKLTKPQQKVLLHMAHDPEQWYRNIWHLNTLYALEKLSLVEDRPGFGISGGWEVRLTALGCREAANLLSGGRQDG